MRNKLLTMRNAVLAVLAAAIAACLTFGILNLPDRTNAYAAASDVFTYDEADATVITGLNESEASKPNLQLVIPAEAKKIANGAFMDLDNVVKVTFEANGDLNEIGEMAFSGTGISEIAIPAKVKTIGDGAFLSCENLTRVTFEGKSVTSIGDMAFSLCSSLNSVELPDLAHNIAYGEEVFESSGDGFYLIAKDRDDYLDLCTTSNIGGYVENLTYPVTIKYVRDDVEIATEQRLFNADYRVQFINNMWIMTAIETVGPSSLKWYSGDTLATVDFVTGLLNGDFGNPTDGEITLYSFNTTQKEFIARTDIVFDESRTYETSEINDLLASESDKVEKGMKVEIIGFTPFTGTDDSLPDVIHDAGNYEIKITIGDVVERTVRLTVAQKTVNLGDYSQLSWRVKGVNGNTELREMALYVYVKDGKEYPSNAVLSDSQREDLGITSGSYTTRQVLYSAARYTGNEITLCIQSNPAFKVTYPNGEATFTEVGAYKATAKLVANPNYKLTTSSASNMRGLTITNSPDGSYAVTKNWYIVNINNWLVDDDGADYKINNFIYGQNPGAGAPKLKYNNYNGSSPSFNLVLQLNGVQIGEAFTPAEIGNYVNRTMPAGDYKLIATVGAVTSKDSADAEAIYHAEFTETCAFTVSKKTLQDLGNFIEAINGNEFVYKWDGKSHFFEQSAEVQSAWGNFLDKFVIPTGIGVWKNYGQYYGKPVITYNLESMQSSEYIPAETISTSDADTYVVYYKVSAPNYYDSLANSTEEKRKEYSFTVINVKEVMIPVIKSETYTGKRILANVVLPSDDTLKPLYYTVLTNEGGIDAGNYEVELKLIDPVHYMWEGQTVENKTATAKVSFTIDKSSENRFTTTLGITTWVVGRYHELEDFPVAGEALFGDVKFALCHSDDIENEIYSGANQTEAFREALMKLRAGTYILTASVEGTDNYNGLISVITFRVLEKDGLPWWATVIIVVGTLGIVATIFFILHQKGILQMLTGKVIIAMRTRATVDATIAAVRANKVAAAAKITVAKAEARDRLEALREAKANAKNMTAEEQAAALEEKAQAAARNAEKLQKRSNRMQKRADKIKKQSDLQDAQAQAEQTVVSEEQSEQTSGEQPKEEN